MKVKELIEELTEFDPEIEVVTWNGESIAIIHAKASPGTLRLHVGDSEDL